MEDSQNAAQHTPGPWTANDTLVFFGRRVGGFDLRNCPNAEANARLIAAAPDMLAALQELAVHYLTTSPNGLELALAAIEKATGRKDA